MPGGDGTGPIGGAGAGTGRGQRKGMGGRGRNQGPMAGGPNGECVCPQCGKSLPHQRGIPCMERKCPQCGSPMARK